MEAFSALIKELKRSDWNGSAKEYNGIKVAESSETYNKTLDLLFSDAINDILNCPSVKQDMIIRIIEDCERVQSFFEVPSKELIERHLIDYENSKRQIRGLKDDYEFLLFVKKCMEVQFGFLYRLKSLISPSVSKSDADKAPNSEDSNNNDQSPMTNPSKSDNILNEKIIQGVDGLAKRLRIGKTKAQSILNSNKLQDSGCANRVGNKWIIDDEKLTKLLSEDPEFLHI